MDKVAVSELRANIMNVLKKVETGSVVDITSRGKVVAKLVPPDFAKDRAKNKLRELGKKAIIKDIISPVDDNWKVN